MTSGYLQSDELPSSKVEFITQARDPYGWRDLYSTEDGLEARASIESWMDAKPGFRYRIITVTHTATLLWELKVEDE